MNEEGDASAASYHFNQRQENTEEKPMKTTLWG
jgi:hypothetical protein